jgi:cytochrome P450
VRLRERNLVSFGRGTRNCLGQNLALCEMYCSIGSLFHAFDDLALAPGFGRKDMDVVELLLGYHPKKAERFKIVRGDKVTGAAW